MKKLKKLILGAVFTATMILTACGSAEIDDSSENDSLPEPEYENPIVFIYQYTNWAWGYQNSGSFVDLNGDVYAFDFGDVDGESTPIENVPKNEELIELLLEIRETEEPVRHVDVEDIESCYRKIGDVDESADIVRKSVACDAGQNTLYIADGYKLIMLESDGDWQEFRDDKAAKKLARKYERIMKTD